MMGEASPRPSRDGGTSSPKEREKKTECNSHKDPMLSVSVKL